MKINDTFRAERENSVLCWLATVSPEGAPNVSPKEIFALHDDETLVVADIMSPNTVRNIRSNPKVCLSFIDVFRQKGFKVDGEASVFAKGSAEFEDLGGEVLEMAGADFPVRNIIRVRISRISRILAPSYALFPDRSEAERMRAAYDTYGVRPA